MNRKKDGLILLPLLQAVVVLALLLFGLDLPKTGTVVYGQSSEPSCTDSDGGLIYNIAGSVEGIGPNGWPYTKYDACDTGDYEGYLKEFYCNGTTPWPVRYQCPVGCADGACLPETCTDNDGDTYAIEGGACGLVDCDDGNPDVNPGAIEVCDNGLDDDCDGQIDAADSDCLICTDADEDGYAVEGGDCGLVDCDDDEADVNPSVTEVCDNGIDDNCNGLSDANDPICSATPNIIVVGWDGTQRDHFWECYNQDLPECPDGLPNIKALSGGVIWSNTTTSGGTATKPGWAQIFTGYNAEVTGIYDLTNYQPIPEGYTVFEKIEDHFGADNVVTMFVSGKGVHTGAACVGEWTTCTGEPCIEELGQPWCLTKFHLDYYENDLRRNDVVGNRALELLEIHQNDLFFALFLFREPDVVGHLAGEDSVHYSESMIDVDQWLGRIVNKLQELDIFERTLVYVTTDHGFDEGTDRHGNAPFGIFASSDPLVARSGDRKDIAATILERYGISTGAIGDAPPVHGYSLYSIPPLVCIPEGGAYLDYPGAPTCCAGLEWISLSTRSGPYCIPATGGTGDASGYCTACGDGICLPPENRCNCPEDCF
jgi:hypothetical protein